jgi:transcription elongation factor GreA
MKYHITKEGLEKLKEKLEYLKKEGRKEIAERLKRAKEYGDLSENSEYIEAKEAQVQIENKILELEEMIRNAVLITKAKNQDVVSIGSTVHVKKDGKIEKFTIVGSEEARPEEYLISNESPLGSAFLGKRVGDEVEIELPSGKVKYKVVTIE